jgi:hypothetical protein
MFLGLMIGFVVGAVWGHDLGKLQAIDAMRRYADAQTPRDATLDDIRDAMRRMDAERVT